MQNGYRVVLVLAALLSAVQCQSTISISANAFAISTNGLQTRAMAPGTIMGTMTIAGGNGNFNFQDPNAQFSILRSSTGANQAWIINRVSLPVGTYTVPITVTDSAGSTATTTTTITIT